MTWIQVPDAEAAHTWDRQRERLHGASLLQSYGWGVYKQAQGWTPSRWIARTGGDAPVAMVQLLVRMLPGRCGVAWSPGGIVGPLRVLGAGLFDQVRQASEAHRLYCRMSFNGPATAGDIDHLRAGGWVRPRHTVGAPIALTWHLGGGEEDVLAALTANWRHNLTRARRRNLQVSQWADASPAELAALYESMAAHKQVAQDFDAAALAQLFRAFGDRLVIYGCRGESGAALAMRACVIEGGNAWDLLAATSPEGRRCYAAYAVCWGLAQHCHAAGVTTYDLGGADPVRVPGVYDFKRGTGAREHECLGEWEWSTSKVLALAVNTGIRLRGGRAVA